MFIYINFNNKHSVGLSVINKTLCKAPGAGGDKKESINYSSRQSVKLSQHFITN